MKDHPGRVYLANAHIVDGTGEPGFAGDLVISGDRIERVIRRPRDGGKPRPEPAGSGEAGYVDLRGLVLAPGFIDIHTHYDAQVLWDRELSPSPWHGVTTVVMGNCGFGVAPSRASERPAIIKVLEQVEGMSAEVLQAGISDTFESFGDYLGQVEALDKRINVGALLGHSPLRIYVMGAKDAFTRAATPQEVREMAAIVESAIGDGALGFATSRWPNHYAGSGQPVPSRMADLGEVYALAGAMASAGGGVFMAIPGGGLFLRELAALSKRHQCPVTWNPLSTGLDKYGPSWSDWGMPELGWPDPCDIVDYAAGLGGEVYPQIGNRPIVMQFTLSEPPGSLTSASFTEVLAAGREGRLELYRNSEWRDRARAEVMQRYAHFWSRTSVQETGNYPELIDIPLDELAAERGTTPFDVMLDIAVGDNLATRFRSIQSNDDEGKIGELLRDRRVVLGLSDAGAHISQLCDAVFATDLLGRWVREKQELSLEEAVWRLTGQPAHIYRIGDRGVIREGNAADLVAFDPATVATEPLTRVTDLPAGGDRLIARSRGIEHVWVNGERIIENGSDVPSVYPGTLIKRNMPGASPLQNT